MSKSKPSKFLREAIGTLTNFLACEAAVVGIVWLVGILEDTTPKADHYMAMVLMATYRTPLVFLVSYAAFMTWRWFARGRTAEVGYVYFVPGLVIGTLWTFGEYAWHLFFN
jgi:hypothetical protein